MIKFKGAEEVSYVVCKFRVVSDFYSGSDLQLASVLLSAPIHIRHVSIVVIVPVFRNQPVKVHMVCNAYSMQPASYRALAKVIKGCSGIRRVFGVHMTVKQLMQRNIPLPRASGDSGLRAACGSSLNIATWPEAWPA